MSVKDTIKSVLKLFFGKKPVNLTAQITQLAPTELLNGRCALITGGSSGIGYAIAQAMLNAGASVIITGRNEAKLESSVAKLQASVKEGRCVEYESMDNSDVKTHKMHWNSILQKVEGREIDILVNNAGTNSLTERWGGQISEEEYDSILNTNLKGTYFFSELVARYMIESKIQGNILNIASSSSLRPGNSAYILSKWGIRSMTLGMAKELMPYGIVVNGVAPGSTATPMLNKSESDNIYLSSSPLGRYSLPEEIANMAVILTSSMGRTIVVDIVYMTGGSGVITVDDANYKFK